jgi:hypothetical protein
LDFDREDAAGTNEGADEMDAMIGVEWEEEEDQEDE